MAKFKQKPLKQNPFQPSLGAAPPCLAGREEVQEVLDIRLEQLQDQRAELRPIGLFGPRGTGKTALLRRFKSQCEAAGIDVINKDLPELLASEEELANGLFPPSVINKVRSAGVSLGPIGVQASLRNGMAGDLTDLLIARCRARPLALLLDEAQLVAGAPDPLPLRFLGMCQRVLGESPFLLVLAGLPGMRLALMETGAGYMERAGYHEIGLLEPADAAEAISAPLEEDKIAIADDALQAAVEDSQGYPHFLQFWGEALWKRAMRHGIPALSKDDAQHVAAAVQERRLAVYHDRYMETRKDAELEFVADTVAGAFIDRDAIHFKVMMALVDKALLPLAPDRRERWKLAYSLMTRLERLGFVWMPGVIPVYRPGIPSLMDYTRDQAAALPERSA